MDGVNSHGIHSALNLSPELPITYTAGNHEYYGLRRDKAIRVLKSAFENTCVHLLINETLILKGYKFIVNDFRKIRDNLIDICKKAGIHSNFAQYISKIQRTRLKHNLIKGREI